MKSGQELFWEAVRGERKLGESVNDQDKFRFWFMVPEWLVFDTESLVSGF